MDWIIDIDALNDRNWTADQKNHAHRKVDKSIMPDTQESETAYIGKIYDIPSAFTLK